MVVAKDAMLLEPWPWKGYAHRKDLAAVREYLSMAKAKKRKRESFFLMRPRSANEKAFHVHAQQKKLEGSISSTHSPPTSLWVHSYFTPFNSIPFQAA